MSKEVYILCSALLLGMVNLNASLSNKLGASSRLCMSTLTS